MPRESAARLAVLVRHNLLLMVREPGPVLSRMILPLVFVTLLRPLYVSGQGRTAGTEQAVVGTLVTFSLLALGICGSAVLTERLGRTWDRLRATALRPAELLVGKVVPAFAALLVQQFLIVGFGVCVFGLRVPHPFLLLGVLLSWSCALLGIGTLIGVLVRSAGALSAAFDIGGMLLSSVGGALVPLDALLGLGLGRGPGLARLLGRAGRARRSRRRHVHGGGGLRNAPVRGADLRCPGFCPSAGP